MLLQVRSCIGLLLLAGIAWLFSENRRCVAWQTVLVGISLQIVLGAVFILNPAATGLFTLLNQIVLALSKATAAGTSMVFGYLGQTAPPFAASNPGNYFVLAFQALPLILVVSALSSLLFYWRILPLLVQAFAWLLQKTMRVSGCEGMAAAANVFIGMVEAPLLIRPYLSRLSRSELFCVMVGGMTTIAGTMMVLYAQVLGPVIGQTAFGHILAASILSAPAAIVVARLMVPETSTLEEGGIDRIVIRSEAEGSLDAVVRGTGEGVQVVINVIAMLIVAVALIALADSLLALLPPVQGAPLQLQRLAGWVMAPIVWLIGIPWQEAAAAGGLMGIKTIANEMLAYLALPDAALSARTSLIMTYALCGFANFGSLGIMIGGIGAMAPERRIDVINLGLKSILAGTIATLMTGAVAGMMTP